MTTNASNTAVVRKALNLRYEPVAFRSLAMARQYANRSPKPYLVMLGDDGRFWAVVSSDAGRLHRAGYEFAA